MDLKKMLDEGKFIEFADEVKRNRKKAADALGDLFNDVQGKIEKSDIQQIEGDDSVTHSCVIGCKIAVDGVSTTKIRKFLDKFNEIKEKGEKFSVNDVAKLKIYLAYAVGRENKLKEFGKVMEMLLNKVNADYKNFKIVSQYLEGIVAYHKLAGGKD